MLRKISVDQLKVGMYLNSFCGSWIEHPFWRKAFIISDPKDIQSIHDSCIKEVWIDVSKGLDIPPSEVEASKDETHNPDVPEHKAIEIFPIYEKNKISLEMARAAEICNHSKRAVIAMFEEARMGKIVDTGTAKALVEEIVGSVSRNTGALISLARLKTVDDYTYMHSVAVCAMMVALARQLGLEEAQVRSAGIAGLMHDIGKAMMPMDVLNRPGKLTDREFEIIKTHPAEGHRLLQSSVGIDQAVLDVCLHHHEKIDGSGYPKGLKGNEIGLFAKMGAICDVYDAITSNRPYKNGWDPAESMRKMAAWSKGHFDESVFQAFVKSLGIYPIGSLVRLSSGKLGVVVEQTSKSLTAPKVKAFYSTNNSMRIAPQIIDLSKQNIDEKIISREDPLKWKFHDLTELWSRADQ